MIIAQELKEHNITVNTYAPGITDTALGEHQFKQLIMTPLIEILQPEMMIMTSNSAGSRPQVPSM